MSRAPPPRGQAPVSRDVVDVVRKKISAPAGPPPAGMKNFSAPRAVSSSGGNYRGKENYYDDEEDDGNYESGRYDDRNDKYARGNRPSRSNYEDDNYDDNDRQLPPRAAQYRDDERNDNRSYNSRNSSQDSRYRDHDGHDDDRNNQPYRNSRDAGPRANTSRQSDYYDDGQDPYYNDNRQSNSRSSSREPSRPAAQPARRGYEDEFDDYDDQPKQPTRGGGGGGGGGRYQEEEVDEYTTNNHPPRGAGNVRSSRDQDVRSSGHGIAASSHNFRTSRDTGRDRYEEEDTQAFEEEDYAAHTAGVRGGSNGPNGSSGPSGRSAGSRRYEEQLDEADGYPSHNKTGRNGGMNTTKPMAPPSLVNPSHPSHPSNHVHSKQSSGTGHGSTLGPANTTQQQQQQQQFPISPALLHGMNGTVDSSLDKSVAMNGPNILTTGNTTAAGGVGAAGAASNAVPTGKKLSIFDFRPILKSTYRELKSFVMSSASPGSIVRCYVERSRSGSNMLSPQYSLCADLEDGTGRELMICRKIIQSRSSHYVFSLKSDDLFLARDKRSKLYLGKLRATTTNEYVLYDNGICAAPDDPDSLLEALESNDDYHSNPRDTALSRKMDRDSKGGLPKSTTEDVSLYRRELAVIRYNHKQRPVPQGIRGMEVCIPIVPSTSTVANTPGAAAVSTSWGSRDNMQTMMGFHGSGNSSTTVSTSSAATAMNLVKPFERIRLAGKQNVMFESTCLVFHEKQSRYDPLSSCLVDFKGRAHCASVKNFQLIPSNPMSSFQQGPKLAEAMLQYDAEQDFVFQLGKTTEDCYNMDYKAPLSLLQAFAIAVSRFDAKVQMN